MTRLWSVTIEDIEGDKVSYQLDSRDIFGAIEAARLRFVERGRPALSVSCTQEDIWPDDIAVPRAVPLANHVKDVPEDRLSSVTDRLNEATTKLE